MASDIIITPNKGSAVNNAKIEFIGATTESSVMRIEALPNGALSFIGSSNVGVGTTSPLGTLDIGKSNGSPSLVIGNSNYPSSYNSIWGLQGGAQSIMIFGNNGQNEIRAGNTVVGGYLDFYTNNTAAFTSASNGNFAMRLAASGNVGIGTTSPGAKLDVNGSQILTGDFGFSADQTARLIWGRANGGAIRIRSNSAAASDRNVQFGNADNNGAFSSYMTVAEGGNLGIGTTSPSQKLDVSSTTAGAQNIVITKANSGNGNENSGNLYFDNYGPANLARNANVELGSIYFRSSQPSSAAIQNSARIQAIADGSQTGLNTQAALTFAVVPNGSTLVEAMRINSGGTIQTAGSVVVGGNFANNPYNSVASTRLYFGGANDVNPYYIGTNLNNYGGNYTKLDLAWHTGIRLGARANYGGVRFFSDETLATQIFSVGETDGNVRVANNLYSPIYYDSNNTAYYVDPASTSNLNILNIGDGNLELYKSVSVDMSNVAIYSVSNYYPVTINVGTEGCIIQIQNNLNTNVPSWSTHAGGFTLNLRWRTNGSGWGTTEVRRYIEQYHERYANQTICGGITQMTNNSTEVVWLRGGGFYSFKLSRDLSPTPRSTAYTVSGQTVTPTSAAQNTVWNSASGTSFLYTEILYDYNNSAYYCDPASTSNLNAATFAGGVTVGGNVSLTNGFIYSKQDQAHRWTSDGTSSGTIRGDIYTDSTGVMVLRTGATPTAALTLGATQAATFAGAVSIAGDLTVGNGTSSRIYMSDTDEGTRQIHCNSNRIGFLDQNANWGAYCDDSGNWFATNLSGTNTGDQTVGNGALTLAVSGTGLSGSASFSANQSGATTFTVVSNATSANTASTIVARDASGNFTAGTVNVTKLNVAGDSYINFNNEEAAWGIRSRNTLSTTNLTTNLKNIIYSGGGLSEGLAIKGAEYLGITAMEIQNNGTVWSYASMRSPIFYDSNDTAYYVDPASTSRVNTLNVVGTVSGARGVFSDSSGSGAAIIEAYSTVATNGTTAIIRQTTGGGNGNQDIGLLVDIQGAADTDRIANFRYYNGSTYTSRMAIMRGGNVGIGTTSPGALLEIGTNATAITGLIVHGGDGGSGTTIANFLKNGGGSAVHIQGHGNVGIGTTNAAQALSLGDAKNLSFQNTLGGTGTYGAIYSYNALVNITTPATAIRFLRDVANIGPDGAIALDTNNTERFRITSAGNVGIGTTAPNAKLNIAGATGGGLSLLSLEPSDSTSASNKIVWSRSDNWTPASIGQVYSSGTNYGGNLVFSTHADDGVVGGQSSPIERMRIFANGNVSIASTASSTSASTGALQVAGGIGVGAASYFGGTVATGALTVTGAITATGNITAYFSDDRLKTRLGPITDPIAKIKALTGFYFEPNQTAQRLGYEKKTDVGVSAQEVQAILPEIIAPAPIDAQYMTVRYEKLIPLLIEAIKAQQAQIEELKAHITIIQQNLNNK